MSPSQAKQFKDAFQLVDDDKDGLVSLADLDHVFASLGVAPSKDTLDALLAARPGPINFTTFLAMMTERLAQFDPLADITDAFECFDDADSGTVKVDQLRKWLSDVGDRMDKQEIDSFLDGSFTDRHGNFRYRDWLKSLSVDDQS